MGASARLLDRKSREQTGAEGSGWHMTEAAVRADVVVIIQPCRQEPPSVSEAFEHVLVQAFVSDAPVQAFGKAVLSRLTRRDVMPFDALLLRPRQNRAARKLRSVVADDA